ncbi:serpin family protein [Lyngbya sp. CCY1209]|jgi:serpin B|uniref:serpin family protein n=1 Tax=Lyngbya sp. CCY1209 TaxID=2886103 RepID=UPI002D204CD0|nr:serpin family protein [Lyngbya sp. CCY1209]MEB3885978.1 serpin family protein [Lyngbya sp. CCY1209]
MMIRPMKVQPSRREKSSPPRSRFLLALLLSVWGVCHPALAHPLPEPPADNPPEIVAVESDAIVNQNNQFALDLYNRLQTETGGNLFFSPYSLSVGMAMTYAGARTETAAEIARVFHFERSPDSLHPEFTTLLNNIKTRTNSQLCIVNRLWGQSGYTFQEPFLEITRTYYDAPLTPVDFRGNTEASRQQINAWVSQETQNQIRDLIPAGILDEWTRLVLTNAVYFKGDWLFPFPEELTAGDRFTLPSGEEITVPMMHHPKVAIGYYKLPDLQVLELPYAAGNLSMVVLLPDENSDLQQLEKKLTIARLESWIEASEYVELEVWFPKFQLTSSFKMKSTLSSMGMKSAFTEAADLSGISPEKPFYLYDVVHKAFVDVNERGTEASAATGVIAGSRSAVRDRIRVDRPFIFLIRDFESGTILFLGAVLNPLERE